MRHSLHSVIFVVTVLFSITASAQSPGSFDPSGNITPSAETFSVSKYGKLSPAMYTGAMSYILPVFTYEDPEFTVPISLAYHFDGYRPAEHSGVVGYGWALDCGGVITREVRGIPDEGPVFQNGSILGWAQARAEGITYSYSSVRSINYSMNSGPYGLNTILAKTLSYDPLSDTPVFVTSAGVKCDPSPDIFHFNFCGYSGDFVMLEDGTIRVFNSSVPFGEFSVSFTPGSGSPHYAQIVIRTGDGYKYYFGGSINNVETFHATRASSATYPAPMSSGGYGVYESGPSSDVTAFRLYKIEAPASSNLKVEFSYSSERQFQRSVTEIDRTIKSYEYYYGVNVGGGGGTTEDASMICGRYYSLLESVKVNGSTVVSFSYQNRTSDEESASSYDFSNINSYVISAGIEDVGAYKKRLSGITVRNIANETVLSCTLTQTYADGTPKMFLTKVSGLKEGDYDFAYNLSGVSLPRNDSKSTDHWGYWNGKSVSSLRNIVKIDNDGYPDSNLYNQINGTYKEADATYSSRGALTTITYPTGGTTTISYEGNTVSRRRTFSADAAPCTPYQVGGVRVRQFTHSSAGYGNMLDHVTYHYSEMKGGTTSGILYQMPRYASLVSISYNVSSYIETCRVNAKIVVYSGAASGFPNRDGHVGYSTVIEEYEDGSWQRNTFTSAALAAYCDSHEYDSWDIEKSVFWPYDSMDISSSTPLLSPSNNDRRNMRGRILETDLYNAAGTLRKSITNSYNEDVIAMQGLFVNTARYYDTFHWSARSPLLSSTTEISYEAEGSLSKTKSYTYNSRGQVTCEAVSGGSAAGTLKSYHQYLVESSPSTQIPSAKTATVVTRSFGGTERIASKQTYTYSGNNVRPVTFKKYYIQTPPVTTPNTIFSTSCGDASYDRTTTFTYDYRYRLLNVSLAGGAYISYTWTGNHITRKNENGGGKTDYTWKDLVGLTSITSPGGQLQSYVYDGKGRLQQIKDMDGNLVSKYYYFFNNDVSSSSTYGLGGDNYIAQEVFTSDNGLYSYKDAVYYNGLGYEEQQAKSYFVSSLTTLHLPIVYDSMRRPDTVGYLPYVKSSSNLQLDPSAINSQASYYQSNFSDSRGYTNTTYESTPEGRPTQTIKAGAAWSSHPTTLSYRVSEQADSILNLSFAHSTSNPTVTFNGFQSEECLLCTAETDEDGRESRLFTDPFGRLICSRQMNVGRSGQDADTYYVYDLRDSLVCVVAPEAAAKIRANQLNSFTFGDTFSSGGCFMIWRDGFGRPVGTSAPGGGRITTQYDTRGRIGLVRSAQMQNNSFEKVYHYDTFNRVTSETYQQQSGTQEYGGRRDYSYYSYSGSGTDFGSSYAFVPDEAASLTDRETLNIKGFLKHEVLRPVPELDKTNHDGFTRGREYYYDKHGRVIQTVEVDSDGWKARYSSKYDFLGNIVKTREVHISPAGDSTVLVSAYTRKRRGQVESYARNLNGSSLPSFSYSYNDLGHLSKRSSGSFKQEYTYDIHGWEAQSKATYLTSILLQEDLRYAVPVKSGGTALWSGRISEIASTLQGRAEQTYDYSYNNAWRISGAKHYNGSTAVSTEVEKDITYDLDGNLTALKRYGTSALVDDLTYTYTGGRLTSVSDAVDSQTYSYTYDANGNMLTDSRKGIQLAYNALNLQAKVLSGSSVLAQYEYLTDGTKLSALSGNGVGYKYRGNFLYSVDASGSEALESIGCDEGRIVITYSSTGVPSYKDYWQVKDHLGSVRAVYDLSTTGTIDSKKKELSDYQPYGNRIARTSTSYNHWRFSGKEEQKIDGTDFGLLDFGARYYDPWLARWTTQDPLAHKYAGINPYVYCNGDPVNLVDLNGKEWEINGSIITVYLNFTNSSGLSEGVLSQYLNAINELFNSIITNASSGHYSGRVVFSRDNPDITQSIDFARFIDPSQGGSTSFMYTSINMFQEGGVLRDINSVAQSSVHELFHTVRVAHPFELTQSPDTELISIGPNSYITTHNTDPNIVNNIMNYGFTTINGQRGWDMVHLTKGQFNFVLGEIKLQNQGYGYFGNKRDKDYVDYWVNWPGTPVH